MNTEILPTTVPNQIINSDCLAGLKELPDSFIDCCVTSPPYFGLRDYGHEGQIGMEETPEAFVQRLVNVFSEVKRVLKPEGTLWLNIGDSYAGGAGRWSENGFTEKQATNAGSNIKAKRWTHDSVKAKDLIGVPWMLAFALRSSGWYLRQDIIWHKPNPMPESVTDRCTKSHEYIFLLSKSKQYFYDNKAVQEKAIWFEDRLSGMERNGEKYRDKVNGKYDQNKAYGGGSSFKGHSGNFKADGTPISGEFRNKRSVWTVTTKSFSEAHFATFPEDLIVDCIKAGCPIDGLVLDPFMGAGTTALVARKLNRNFIGFELNPEYIKIAEKRLSNELGMFQ